MQSSYEDRLARARAALEKSPAYGPDVDINQFLLEAAAEEDAHIEPAQLSDQEKRRALHAGIIASEEGRSGTFFQRDTKVLCARPRQEGLEVMSTTGALKKHEWLEELLWTAVAPDADKYTAAVALHRTHGYFIRTLPGVKTTYPVQACLYIGKKDLVQRVHNVIIAEPGSELHIITGCTTSEDITSAMHIGISEFFVRRGATVTFTMVHTWGKEVHVRPRTGVIVEEGGTFINNYICLREVDSLQMYPSAYLRGPGARARMNSILYGVGSSRFDVGGKIVFDAPETSGEIISRVIAADSSEIVSRGLLVGASPRIKGHLECQGLLLSDTARIAAVPELDARLQDIELSHEAAVGRLAEDQILYLMSRGLTAEQATSLLVRGFLNVDIEGLPPDLEAETKRLLEMEYQGLL